MGSRCRETTTTRRREKREERREKREQLYSNRVSTFPGLSAEIEVKREKREEITKKAARDPQID